MRILAVRVAAPCHLIRMASAMVLVLLSGLGAGQKVADEESQGLVPLPPLTAHKLSHGEYLIFRTRFGSELGEFARELRKVPWVPTADVVRGHRIRRYLNQDSIAVRSDLAYLESHSFSREQLRVLAALVRKTDHTLRILFGGSRATRFEFVFLPSELHYIRYIKSAVPSARERSVARTCSSWFVDKHRVSNCGKWFPYATRLVVADTSSLRGPRGFREFDPLQEGLHSYLTAFLLLDFEAFVDVEVTTPRGRTRQSVEELFRVARTELTRSPNPMLLRVLLGEMNTTSFERLAVACALWDYLIRFHRPRLPRFTSQMERQRNRNWQPNRREALEAAFRAAFGESIGSLEVKLREHARTNYALEDEQLCAALAVKRVCGDAWCARFRKAIARRRAGKELTSREQRALRRVHDAVEKLLAERAEQF